jgi:hypothetical protein
MPYKDPNKQREFQRLWQRKQTVRHGRTSRVLRSYKLQAWLNEMKVNSGCVRCGEKDIRCLVFHHIRDKSYGISQMAHRGFAKETILAELEKCIVLCANCHSKEHYGEQPRKWYD